ncbi:glycosyltransferase [Rossellomorea vietnamensis]|uniref:glycosyltransferase n=1 Tax=Rossellomorea vietnamensis TaxID=218284 RepID=UPI001CCCD0D1|nr:glycosyltransferase [Rossellomorea vietnamensis]MCA0147607.1 glycosyltransferase [Rossellomorea vietnamensis]
MKALSEIIVYPTCNECSFSQVFEQEDSLTALLIENGELIDFLDRNEGSSIPVVLNPLLFSLFMSEEFKERANAIIQGNLLQADTHDKQKWQLIYSQWSTYDMNLVQAYKHLAVEGKATVIPTSVSPFPLTHYRTPRAIESQVRMSTLLFKQYFHMIPKSFWLPQAAYVPGIDLYLTQQGIEYTFISSFSYEHSEKEQHRGVIRTPRGLKLIPVREGIDSLEESHPLSIAFVKTLSDYDALMKLDRGDARHTMEAMMEEPTALSRVGFGYLGMEKQVPIMTDSAIRNIRVVHRMEEQLENMVTLSEETEWTFQIIREWISSMEGFKDDNGISTVHFDRLLQQVMEGHKDGHLLLHRKRMMPFPSDEILEKLSIGIKGDVEEKHDSVLILSWEYPPNIVGGLSRHVYDLANNLVKKGKHVHVLTTMANDALPLEKMEGVTIHRVHPLHPYEEDFFKWVFDLNQSFIQYAHDLIRDERITHIHAHDWIVSTSAMKLKDYYALPLITTIHATEHGRNQGIYTDLQHKIHGEEQLLIGASDHLIVCSEHMKDEIKSLFTIEAPIAVIPNGVELEKLDQSSPYALSKPSKPYFFSIGRMVHEKGFETIIRVASRLKSAGYDISFVIAGKGPMLEQYRKAVIEEELSDSVSFVGYVSDRERNDYLKNCLAVIFPSLYEPFGIVALEAMAFRKGVVASNTGGLKSIVKHEQTGLLFEPNQEHSLYTQLISLIENPGKSEQLGELGFKMAQSMFSWDRIADQTIHVYDDVLLQSKVEGIKR